ncbi:oxidoreductase [Pontibacter sp. BT310]|uniref:Oxidoreductase n=1 Tax=Pontibacter populi TaxID=890055 RepID=A0ABS6X9N8_9BACT|nr:MULTISPECIES: oxidoreductase [Pontibacter]MBJ6117856.1 oxidoreductase [Pontibacter sp. BT310]MBR0570283.1 oxidoreductase [Microvirga sp. STS03]MBW3364709.1 oxidoreductase [Pontibacter populi]
MAVTINVGLIGFGMSGRLFHAPFIANLAGLKLKKIKANRPESIALAQQQYPETEIVATEQDIFEDETIDLVVIATANPTHYSLAKAALQANKHVIVDKPFTITSSEADELIALAKEKQKVLTVYQNRRWDSDFKTIKKVLEANLLGKLVDYEAHFDRFRNEIKPDTWKEENLPGAGILYDLGAHLIDQALVLFGEPQQVYANIKTQRSGSQIPDYFEVVLFYHKLKVILKAGMLVREAGPHFILHGTKGSFIKYGMDVQEANLKGGSFPTASSANWGQEPEELWGTVNRELNGLHFKGKIESKTGDYSGLYQNVYHAIVGQEELAVKPEQARNTIRIIELAMQSSQEKRTITYSYR